MVRLFKDVPRSIGSARRREKGTIKPIIEQLRQAGVTLCEDSIRRRAARLGLIEPKGAKYIPTNTTRNWSRPCLRCKCTDTRPRLQYICDRCKRSSYD